MVCVVGLVVRGQSGGQVPSPAGPHLIEQIQLLETAPLPAYSLRPLFFGRRGVVEDALIDEQRRCGAVTVDQSLRELAFDERVVQPVPQQCIRDRMQLGIATDPPQKSEHLACLVFWHRLLGGPQVTHITVDELAELVPAKHSGHRTEPIRPRQVLGTSHCFAAAVRASLSAFRRAY